MVVSLIAIGFGIAAIILLTTRFSVHPFFALLIACFIVGIITGLPISEILATSKEGFGNILKSLGFIIVLGTTLGIVLEYTGGTHILASFLLKRLGTKNAPLAMSLTGFLVGLPIFCDSGFIVLSGLNKAVARPTSTSAAVIAVSMATGLYSVHCLIPPHPGATAAAATIGVDYGRLILIGVLVAVPAMLAGYAWAVRVGKNSAIIETSVEEKPRVFSDPPSVVRACLPILIPILLIAVRSFFTLDANTTTGLKNLLVLGDPVIALFIGILLALNCKRAWKKAELNRLLVESVEKAGGILVIIGAGGAFGAVLVATKLSTQLHGLTGLNQFNLAAIFLLTFLLKTAQGSSTVAIITAASIVQPLLPTLGLTTENEKLLSVLAMGAGSMMISHANDAYFWVIAKFSDLPIRTLLKVYSIATMLMAVTSLAVIYILSFIL